MVLFLALHYNIPDTSFFLSSSISIGNKTISEKTNMLSIEKNSFLSQMIYILCDYKYNQFSSYC